MWRIGYIHKNFNQMFLLVRQRVKQKQKCYICGHITLEKYKYCPICMQDGFKIRMIQMMEKDTVVSSAN